MKTRIETLRTLLDSYKSINMKLENMDNLNIVMFQIYNDNKKAIAKIEKEIKTI